ncbi:hypothetical protein F2Q70_00013300 [Brassica cretica]|uniref:Uncharacterized protein n=2 Tax=Brassica cretica TaxID=69181 RepID=A0A8S9M501_BRACR|nr:hypothetical protein F2Q70_00013300 [Brassica cretica]KAF3512324.1 hypothetical protein F2Q69_00009380 [Brassica cretica]KAF3549949.1 hypothetical protein DY000_02009796 [Brassica cretica]
MMWGATVEGEERTSLGNELKTLDLLFDRVMESHVKMVGKKTEEEEDFLQYLIRVKDEDEKAPLSLTHVKSLLMDMVLGGVDTIVEESHLPKLPYLQAVMKETLRLHPTLPLLVPHRNSETSVVAGYTVPKDSKIFINVWAIHRDPKHWDEPNEFKPERFLENSLDFNGGDFKYLPFGSGRRICAAINMAERLVLFNIASLLHSFDWVAPKGQKFEVEEKFGLVLKLKSPLVAIPVPRLSDPKLYTA